MSKYMRIEVIRMVPYHTSIIAKVKDDDQMAIFEMYPDLFSEPIIKQAILDDNWEKAYEFDIYDEDCEISCIDEIEDYEDDNGEIDEPYDGEIVDLSEVLKEQKG